MYHASLHVLQAQGFQLDRQDYRFGRITTKPIGASTVMEPWQADNSTPDQALENTLNSQRRWVSVRLEPTEATPDRPELSAPDSQEPGDYHLRVEVFVERQQFPRRQLDGSTGGHGVFYDLAAVPGELQVRGVKQGQYWQPLGRDSYLEQRLLGMIVRQSLTLDRANPSPTR